MPSIAASTDSVGATVSVVVALLGALVAGRVALHWAGRFAAAAGQASTIAWASLANGMRAVGLRRAVTTTLGLGASGASFVGAGGPASAAVVPTSAAVQAGPAPMSRPPSDAAALLLPHADDVAVGVGSDRTPGTATGSVTAEDGSGEIVVAAGDSLWSISARSLGPHATSAAIARDWPVWYRLNRDRIGPDPSLLHPGTPLRVPDRRRTGTSATSNDRPSQVPAPSRIPATSLDPDRR